MGAGSFFTGLLDPNFSHNDFKKRSMSKSNVTNEKPTPTKRRNTFEDGVVLRKSVSYTSKENVPPSDTNQNSYHVSDVFRPSFVEQSAEKRENERRSFRLSNAGSAQNWFD
jgi:hypothetical protein